MPVSCEPAELIANAKCLDNCIPKGLQMAVLILLFGELIDMPSDAQTLLDNATCLDQCIPDGSKMSVLISLACQIVEQGGTGGGGGGESGTGSPEGVVTAEPGTTYLDISTGNFWAKQSGSGNTGWIQLIG